MSSLWSRGLNSDTFNQQSQSSSTNSSMTDSTNPYLIHQINFESPQQQQVRISPTMTVIDAHFGLPTAAVAEIPMRSSATSVADFPSPSASLTSRTHSINLTSRSAEDTMVCFL